MSAILVSCSIDLFELTIYKVLHLTNSIIVQHGIEIDLVEFLSFNALL